jgi:hypothetical protein
MIILRQQFLQQNPFEGAECIIMLCQCGGRAGGGVCGRPEELIKKAQSLLSSLEPFISPIIIVNMEVGGSSQPLVSLASGSQT